MTFWPSSSQCRSSAAVGAVEGCATWKRILTAIQRLLVATSEQCREDEEKRQR